MSARAFDHAPKLSNHSEIKTANPFGGPKKADFKNITAPRKAIPTSNCCGRELVECDVNGLPARFSVCARCPHRIAPHAVTEVCHDQ